MCRNLVPGQLTTLAGLGALRDLDLQNVGVNQVVRGYAKAPRCNLLDARVADAVETRRVLATLPRVRVSTERVHRHGQGLVGFGGQGANRHSGGVEARE